MDTNKNPQLSAVPNTEKTVSAYKPIAEKPISKLPSLKIIPLGGVGSVTKNMYVYEFGDDQLVVDCGMGFPQDPKPSAHRNYGPIQKGY